MIIIQNKRRKLENIINEFPNAVVVDVTSKGELPYVKFSPFYPIGKIPIPFSEGTYAESVEGVWQGLKVFNDHDIDENKFHIKSMKGLKRTVRKFGTPKGHRQGLKGTKLLDYITARKEIYLPMYNWVLANRLSTEIDLLAKLSKTKDIVLLDYETNEDVNDSRKPLSHASLIKEFLSKK